MPFSSSFQIILSQGLVSEVGIYINDKLRISLLKQITQNIIVSSLSIYLEQRINSTWFPLVETTEQFEQKEILYR